MKAPPSGRVSTGRARLRSQVWRKASVRGHFREPWGPLGSGCPSRKGRHAPVTVVVSLPTTR